MAEAPRPFELIVVGVSAGGLQALSTIFRGLPYGFPIPLAVVQHRARESDALALVLQESTHLVVCEIEDKMPIEAGRAYVAPPDYHLLIDHGHFALSVDAPVTYSRPSIDVLFETAADELGARLIGVVLTGANRDGSRGLRRIVDRGGRAIVQDPATAEVDVMPRAAIAQVPEAAVVPLDQIARHLLTLVQPASVGGAAS
jgi:two-component system, chemotaxis family, protein-glutamate methylesterase/glutaminase